MNGLRSLGLLLLVQAVLALWTWQPPNHADLVPHRLLTLDPDAVDEIAIARRPEGDAEPVWLRLHRDGGAWTVASADDYPADAAKVGQIVERLVGMEVRSPVATTKPSHNALHVGDREYGRRVRIHAGDFDRELVVGAARSNAIYVRFSDEDDVYLADGLSEYALADTPASWWARDYVRAPVEEIRSFGIDNAQGNVSAERTDDGWRVDGTPEGLEADDEAIEQFLGKATSLRLVEPVGPETTVEPGMTDVARIHWTLDAADQSVAGGYGVGAVDGANAFVKADGSRFVVKVTASSVAPVREATRAQFLRPAKPPAEAQPGADAPPAPGSPSGG